MKLVVVDVWVEYSNLVATIWFKGESGEVTAFDVQRPIKILERLLDEEAMIGLYLFELTVIYEGVFYEQV